MSIGENIAKYRKAKCLTQEQLGELLGVTNQAVSKWESGVSMPDIMLLPRIAEALEINIYDLYGTTKNSQVHKGQIQKIDEFSITAQNQVKEYLYHQLFSETVALKELARFKYTANETTSMNPALTLGIIPYAFRGAAFVSDNLSVISSDFDVQQGANNIVNREIFSGLNKLCDPNVTKVLHYMYTKAFDNIPETSFVHPLPKDFDYFEQEFTFDEIASAGFMAENEILDAIEKLAAIHIVEITNKDLQTKYIFKKTKGIETAVVFQIVKRLIGESMQWGCGYIVGHGRI